MKKATTITNFIHLFTTFKLQIHILIQLLHISETECNPAASAGEASSTNFNKVRHSRAAAAAVALQTAILAAHIQLQYFIINSTIIYNIKH